MQRQIENTEVKVRLRKYVLTGGTSVGKTTVIDLLSKLGYATFPEFSRAIINEELKKKNGVLPWISPSVFQDMYAKRQAVEENEIEKYLRQTRTDEQLSKAIFMDRCIIDGIAFCQHAKVAIPKEIDEHVQKIRSESADYDLIFVLEPLDQYHFDEGRVLKPEESLAIQGLIEKSYKDYGYTLISVPFMSPKERVRFILEKVKEFEKTKYLNLKNLTKRKPTTS